MISAAPTLYGADDDKLGKIDDVIFDHATGTIQYAVVDTGGWLSSKKFLVPAGEFAPTGGGQRLLHQPTKQQIESLPKYDEYALKATRSGAIMTHSPRGLGQRTSDAQGRQHAYH